MQIRDLRTAHRGDNRRAVVRDETMLDKEPCGEATTKERPDEPDNSSRTDEACHSETYAPRAQAMELKQGTCLSGSRDGYIPYLPVQPGEPEDGPSGTQGVDDPSVATDGSGGDGCHPEAAAKPNPTVWQRLETLKALTSRTENSQDSTRGEREWRDTEDEGMADSYSLSADHEECLDMEYGSDTEYGANSDEEDHPCTLHDDGSTCQS